MDDIGCGGDMHWKGPCYTRKNVGDCARYQSTGRNFAHDFNLKLLSFIKAAARSCSYLRGVYSMAFSVTETAYTHE